MKDTQPIQRELLDSRACFIENLLLFLAGHCYLNDFFLVAVGVRTITDYCSRFFIFLFHYDATMTSQKIDADPVLPNALC